MRLKGLRVLARMLGPARQMPEPQAVQEVADAAFGQRHAEPVADPSRQVAAAPAHDAIRFDVRSRPHPTGHLLHLFLRQQAAAARRLAVGQPADAELIVTMNPVTKRLSVHSSRFCRLRAGLPFLDERQRQ